MSDSITGFYSFSLDVARLEANIITQSGSLYYEPSIGFDLAAWLQPEAETGFRYSNDSFTSWLSSQALAKGIVTSEVTADVDDYTLVVNYKLAGVSKQIEANSVTVNMGI